MDKKTVKVYIPNTGMVNWRLAKMFPEAEYREFHPIYLNRRHIVKDFLKTDFTHLIMIDHDVIPVKNPVMVADKDLDVVGFPTPIYINNRRQWNVYLKPFKDLEYGSINQIDGKSFQEVDAVGTGCIMIARRVLEKLENHFDVVMKEDDIKYGGDIGFCKRAKEAGFKIWAAWDYPCHHYKTIDLLTL